MKSGRSGKAPVSQSYVSTGRLPSPELVTSLVSECYERLKANRDGRNSDVYPALADVPQDLFGLCVAGVNGSVYAGGDWDCPFSIMSVSKPFVFALVCQVLGGDVARQRSDESDGEFWRNRHDQPRPRFNARRKMDVHPRRSVAICGSRAFAER